MGVLSDNLILKTVLLIGAVIAVRLLTRTKTPGRLPPGPRGLPFLGSVDALPPKGAHEWKHWLKYKDAYGPISSVTAFGTTIVLLHSPELAFELFEKRSSVYSSRSRFTFAGEMIGWKNTVVLREYGKEFRQHRKNIHAMIGTQATVQPYMPIQEKEVHRFLLRVLKDPEGLLDHIRTEAGAMILKMIYGYTIDPHKSDPLVKLVGETLEQFSLGTAVGSWLVDLVPAMKYIPDWLPGADFKRLAKKWQASLIKTADKPFEFAQRRIAKGQAGKSYVSDFGSDLSSEDQYMVKWTAAALYSGGSDTTVNTVAAFFLAISLYPEVQQRAREEIDQVIGTGRLPKFDDRDNLPYINAVVKEALRWHPVLPLVIPHTTSADDMFKGYFIPKDAIVVPNVWWFTHDPAVYKNPSTFDPSRFLGANPCPDPRDHIFGYGRRICPGRFFAYTSIWLTIAQSLAVFDIRKPLDEQGVEIEPPTTDPTVLFSTGAISHPKPFIAMVKPRSELHAELIKEAESLYPWEKGNVDELEGMEA
ncbi:cytochrome P450 oxidoreductase OrdA-like protein [Xylaria sp. CBS 124048]|nr:cytochrome P450 oxidoreductase OrdA-like protein [Xylaria sp. CBS 124048]